MNRDLGELARRLSQIQTRLRQELIEELQEHTDELDNVFDPFSYSPLVHELREKYLTRLYLVQGIIQQLAHHTQGPHKHATRVVRVAAQDQAALVQQVNHRLLTLNGAKVLDVTFVPGAGSEEWSALITYEVNPFVSEPDEKAAWM